MDIITASQERVIMDMGLTYLAYTFSEKFGRYTELINHQETLKSFTNSVETVPTIYDIQQQSKHEDAFISITAQKPEYNPLSESTIDTFSKDSCKDLSIQLIETIEKAREYGIYHLDIGFHCISYDAGLKDLCVFDWYDSVLQTPTQPPFYISEYYPPELQHDQSQYTQATITKAENYQLCCFLTRLLSINDITVPTVLQEGSNPQLNERPTLPVIKEAIQSL